MRCSDDSLPEPPPLPARPVLRPGVHVVRGDPGAVRVCRDGEPDLVLPDDAVTDAVLRVLADGAGRWPTAPHAERLVARLAGRGWLTDADALHGLLRQSDGHRTGVSTLFAVPEQPDETPDPRCRWAARRATTVGVRAHRAAARPAAGLLADTARELGLAASEESAAPAPDTSEAARPDVHVVVSAGEPPPRLLDGWLAGTTPYLVVTGHPDRVRVGPWVVPGVTACHRCVQAARCDEDPGYARRSEVIGLAPEDPAVPQPVDAALLASAAAWAAREVVCYVEGGTPRTWSATWSWAHDLACDRTRWRRHPRCGCGWGEGLASPTG